MDSVTLEAVKDGVVVHNAPCEARFSLEVLLAPGTAKAFLLRGDRIVVAGFIEYQIVGWDADRAALVARRITEWP